MDINDIAHKERLGSIADTIAERIVSISEVKVEFSKKASDAEKKQAAALASDIETVANIENAKDGEVLELFDNMINLTELYAKVLETSEDANIEDYLIHVFDSAQKTSQFKDPEYTNTLESMGATTLAKASRAADLKNMIK